MSTLYNTWMAPNDHSVALVDDFIANEMIIYNIALPCLLYAQEALPLTTKSVTTTIEHPWSRVFMRLFGSWDNKIVAQCQFYTNYLPLEHLINLRRSTFLLSLKSSPCSILRALYELSANDDLSHLADAYSVSAHDFLLNPHVVINNYFVTYVNSISA